jgi:hypothetical protein
MTVVVRPPGGVPSPSAAPAPAVAAVPGDDPGWVPRAAEGPVGLAALVVLVVGIALLVRPRSAPTGRPRSTTPVELRAEDPCRAVRGGAGRPVAPVLELDAERLRRRSG